MKKIKILIFSCKTNEKKTGFEELKEQLNKIHYENLKQIIAKNNDIIFSSKFQKIILNDQLQKVIFFHCLI